MQLILTVCVDNKVPIEEVEDMVLAVFSDMQFNNAHRSHGGNFCTVMDNIKILFNNAGYPNPPHILFWNRKNKKTKKNTKTQKNTNV